MATREPLKRAKLAIAFGWLLCWPGVVQKSAGLSAPSGCFSVKLMENPAKGTSPRKIPSYVEPRPPIQRSTGRLESGNRPRQVEWRTEMCGTQSVFMAHRRVAGTWCPAHVEDGSVSNERPEWWWIDLVIWCLVLPLFGELVSASIGFCGLVAWMRLGSLQVQRGSMPRFAWCGVAAAGMALIVNCLGHIVLGKSITRILAPGYEEVSKFLALICFSWSGLKFWQQRERTSSLWPQSRRALMMAGFCVGVGFMVVENRLKAGFVEQVLDFYSCLFASHRLSFNSYMYLSDKAMSSLATTLLFNTHPYYTGIAAGRFFSLTTSRLSAAKVWHILWPSVVLHAAHNLFAVTQLRWAVDVLTFLLFIKLWCEVDDQKMARRLPAD